MRFGRVPHANANPFGSTVDLSEMGTIADGRMLGNNSGGASVPLELTVTQTRTLLGLATGDTPQLTGVELGHATDTTLTRSSAGNIAVEGNVVYRAGGTDVPLTDGGTGASTAQAARDNLALNTLSTATDDTTVTFDLSLGNKHQVTLGGNRTLALSNPTTGQGFSIRLIQDGTGSRTVTWFGTIRWVGGTVPTLTTTINKADWFGFICTGSGTYDGFVLGTNV